MVFPFSFGTAGIRARAGAGDDELNDRTVRGIAEAVLAYLASLGSDARTRGVCLGFDGREDSRAFAAVVLEAARDAGFLVRAFAEPCPTPLLAFATRLHGSVAGFMITASHNPAADNGIKLYLAGGAQITAPHDAAIEEQLRSTRTERPVPGAPVQRGAFRALGDHETNAYLATLLRLWPVDAHLPLPGLAYTATFGVGAGLTRQVLAQAHAVAHEVPAQCEIRADFGGLRSPNPEHEEALAALRKLADEVHAEVAFAHDPDADRLAVLARDRYGKLRVLSGDEVGAVIGDDLLARASTPGRCLVATTHVSGDLLTRIAEARGARCLRTNTGFKWVTSDARALAKRCDLQYLFGYEEAIGYAFGALGDDKDGIAALHVMLGLIRTARASGQSLLDRLHALFRTFGVHASRQLTVRLDGADAQREALMTRFASTRVHDILGEPGTCTDHRLRTMPATLLELRGDTGIRLCVRPSGTEPKLKLYLHVREPVAQGAAVEVAEARAQAALDALETRVRRQLA
jgi:phosphomannomutase